MPRRHGGSSPVRTGRRRKTGWELGPGTFTDLGAFTASQSVIVGSGIQFLEDGLTLVRTRGFVELVQTGGVALGDGYTGAFGIAIVTAQAFGVGISALPTPITEANWDGWLWHQMFSLRCNEANTDFKRQVFEIDSKAMRKVGFEEVCYMVVEVDEIGDAIMEVTGGSRILMKLP